MMKRISKLGLIAATASMLAAGAAFASPLEMTVNGTTVTLSSTGGYSNPNLDGWDIYFFTGTSNSPSLTPFGIDLSGLTAACLSESCAPLTISISDDGFAGPVGPDGFATALSDTQSGKGSVTQTAYFGQSNGYFDTTETIGSITLNGTGADTMDGGGPASTPYSITLTDVFTASCRGTGCVSFSIDGDVTAASTPEPGTLALFGAGLLGCAIFVGRRRRRSSQARV